MESSILRSTLVLNVGCGLNLDNEEPTLSVNQLLARLEAAPASREDYLAHTFNALDNLISLFNAGKEDHVFQENIIYIYNISIFLFMF